jgi:DNA polymerase (family 10)
VGDHHGGLAERVDAVAQQREDLAAGVKLVCNTDSHSTTGLAGMTYAVHTARRGGATRADVLNTLPLDAILRG